MQKFSHSFPSLNGDGLFSCGHLLLLLDKTNKDTFKQHTFRRAPSEAVKSYVNFAYAQTSNARLGHCLVRAVHAPMLSMESIPLISGRATDPEKNGKTN